MNDLIAGQVMWIRHGGHLVFAGDDQWRISDSVQGKTVRLLLSKARDPVVEKQRGAARLLLHLDRRILGEDLLGQPYATSIRSQQHVAF